MSYRSPRSPLRRAGSVRVAKSSQEQRGKEPGEAKPSQAELGRPSVPEVSDTVQKPDSTPPLDMMHYCNFLCTGCHPYGAQMSSKNITHSMVTTTAAERPRGKGLAYCTIHRNTALLVSISHRPSQERKCATFVNNESQSADDEQHGTKLSANKTGPSADCWVDGLQTN